jgi:hypothetical protein
LQKIWENPNPAKAVFIRPILQIGAIKLENYQIFMQSMKYRTIFFIWTFFPPKILIGHVNKV